MAKDEITPRVHPVAAMYPRPTDEERQALLESVKQNGVIHAATLWKDQKGAAWMIDGLTRLGIVSELQAAGVTHAYNGEPIEMRYNWFEGAHPSQVIDFIDSNNMARRTLSASQRAMVGVRVYKRYLKCLADEQGVSLEDVNTNDAGEVGDRIARRTGTNRQYAYDCLRIADHPKCTDLCDQIVAGVMKISKAKAVMARRESGLSDDPGEDGPEKVAGPAADAGAVLDAFKREVPEDLRSEFGARDEVAQLVRLLKKCRADIDHLAGTRGGANLKAEDVKTDLGNVIRNLTDHQPHAPCPACSGGGKVDNGSGKMVRCKTCAGAKFIDAVQFKFLPDELKNLFLV